MADGTMVVVESGKFHVNQNIRVKVTKVIQSPAGKIVFAALTESQSIPLGPETGSLVAKENFSAE